MIVPLGWATDEVIAEIASRVVGIRIVSIERSRRLLSERVTVRVEGTPTGRDAFHEQLQQWTTELRRRLRAAVPAVGG